MKDKRAQEEMIGFALIIIVVAVILLVFLGFSIRSSQKETVESYEVESFIQSFLQYTTDCEDNIEPLSIRKLIFACNDNEICLDQKHTCEVLNTELDKITKESWKIGENRPVKGYELNITSSSKQIILIDKGEKTSNSKGAPQPLSQNVEITFKAYY